MLDDIRYAVRQLYKNPGFALVSIATLALGIGAASAMFGLIQGVCSLRRRTPDPDRLVLLDPARIDGQQYNNRATMAETLAWRQSRTFAARRCMAGRSTSSSRRTAAIQSAECRCPRTTSRRLA